MSIQEELNEVLANIRQLEEERRRIYNSAMMTVQDQSRLGGIEVELQRLWDMRHRLQAARRAGLKQIPLLPSAGADD